MSDIESPVDAEPVDEKDAEPLDGKFLIEESGTARMYEHRDDKGSVIARTWEPVVTTEDTNKAALRTRQDAAVADARAYLALTNPQQADPVALRAAVRAIMRYLIADYRQEREQLSDLGTDATA